MDAEKLRTAIDRSLNALMEQLENSGLPGGIIDVRIIQTYADEDEKSHTRIYGVELSELTNNSWVEEEFYTWSSDKQE